MWFPEFCMFFILFTFAYLHNRNADYPIGGSLPQTLPGLQNFYVCGQWVELGGGLPTSVMSGRRLVQAMCKQRAARPVAALTA